MFTLTEDLIVCVPQRQTLGGKALDQKQGDDHTQVKGSDLDQILPQDPQEKRIILMHCPQTSNLQNMEMMHCCCLSH